MYLASDTVCEGARAELPIIIQPPSYTPPPPQNPLDGQCYQTGYQPIPAQTVYYIPSPPMVSIAANTLQSGGSSERMYQVTKLLKNKRLRDSDNGSPLKSCVSLVSQAKMQLLPLSCP